MMTLPTPRKVPTENQFISTVFNQASSSKLYPESRESKTSPAAALNFLQVYFDLTFSLLICPFRISRDENGKLIIKKHALQRILCGIMHFLCGIRLFTEARVSIATEYTCKSPSRNPVQYFNIIMDVSSFIYKVVTMKRLWWNQQEYLNVASYIQGKQFFQMNQSLRLRLFSNVWFLRLVFGYISIHAFLSFLLGKSLIDQTSAWSLPLWWSQLVRLARYTFGFNRTFSIYDSNLEIETSGADIFFALLTGLGMQARFLMGLFCDILLLSNAAIIWIASYIFSSSLQGDMKAALKSDQDQWKLFRSPQNPKTMIIYGAQEKTDLDDGRLLWPEVYSRFCTVQRLALLVNVALGSQVTWYMAEAVMYYSVRLNKFLTSNDIFVRVDLAVFYCTTFGILFVSADICSQMEQVKVWISFGSNRKTVPGDEFNIVLHEMLSKDIGLRGSNVFTITYSLLAVFFSTIVTYFIICVQQGGEVMTGLKANNASATC